MKKWLLTFGILISTVTPYQQGYAEESESLKDTIANTMSFSDLPIELQALIESADVEDNIKIEQQLSYEERGICSAKSAYAFNFMNMRQKGYDYEDIYLLIDLSQNSDGLELAENSLDFYHDLLSEAYSYPVYETKYLKGLAISLFLDKKNYECLQEVQNKS
ncbi:hypothetical protein [Psychrobacter sp. FDAARGOS_221]|uniref:hypothetical protein n=1 Tax=Psychrobacter sp. FDAARGOS_221 TaxID=1975705 RepID=UPI000BB59A54|nr:hypothetical protein [Psychrobacter sp. FDAARGOS_221]PNK59659.1 hypothetical protein A6J60_001355 [Psychrobacter sp. FDAARGOS_221]